MLGGSVSRADCGVSKTTLFHVQIVACQKAKRSTCTGPVCQLRRRKSWVGNYNPDGAVGVQSSKESLALLLSFY